MARMVIGRSGWVRYESGDLPARAYLRYRRNSDGRWALREVFVDGLGTDLTARAIGQIPFVTIEAMVNNSPEMKKQMDTRSKKPSAAGGPDDGSNLAVLMSRADDQYFSLDPADSWVAAAYWAEVAVEAREAGHPLDPELPRVARQRLRRVQPIDPSEFRLSRLPGPGGLTEDFLREVALAYAAAVERGEPPNKTLAADSGAPVRTVERWVYTARDRGAMPRGRKGARG